jgi:hypothetical protein
MRAQVLHLRAINQQISAVAHNDPHKREAAKEAWKLDFALSELMALQGTINDEVESFSIFSPVEGVLGYIDNLNTHVEVAIETSKRHLPSLASTNDAVKHAASGPFLTSLVEGLEKLVATIPETRLDNDIPSGMHVLSSSVAALANVADSNGLKGYAQTLSQFSNKLTNIADAGDGFLDAEVDLSGLSRRDLERRSNFLTKGINSAIALVKQRFDSFRMSIKQGNKRPTAALLTNLIAGLDGQIDNLLGIVGKALNPLTDGISMVAVNTLLGPTFQSLTDGIEVLVGNVVGAPIDLLLSPVMHMLSGNLKNVARVADKYQLNDATSALSRHIANLDIIAKKGHEKIQQLAQQHKKGLWGI